MTETGDGALGGSAPAGGNADASSAGGMGAGSRLG